MKNEKTEYRVYEIFDKKSKSFSEIIQDTLLQISETLSENMQNEESVFNEDYPRLILIENTIGFITAKTEWWSENLSSRIDILNDDDSIWYSFDADTYEYSDRSTEWNEDFKPWAFEPIIGVFTMRCIAKTDNIYTIIANEEKSIVKHLKVHKNFQFQTVEEHIVNRLVGTDFTLNPVRETPNDNAPIVYATDEDIYVIASIEREGDWIKIESAFTNKVLGWIRWKKDGRFMIEMYYSI